MIEWKNIANEFFGSYDGQYHATIEGIKKMAEEIAVLRTQNKVLIDHASKMESELKSQLHRIREAAYEAVNDWDLRNEDFRGVLDKLREVL